MKEKLDQPVLRVQGSVQLPGEIGERAEQPEAGEGREVVPVGKGTGHAVEMVPFRIPEDELGAGQVHQQTVGAVAGGRDSDRKDRAIRLFDRAKALQRQPEDGTIGEQAHEGCDGPGRVDADAVKGRRAQQMSGQLPVGVGEQIGQPGQGLQTRVQAHQQKQQHGAADPRRRHRRWRSRAPGAPGPRRQERARHQGEDAPCPGPVAAEGQRGEDDDQDEGSNHQPVDETQEPVASRQSFCDHSSPFPNSTKPRKALRRRRRGRYGLRRWRTGAGSYARLRQGGRRRLGAVVRVGARTNASLGSQLVVLERSFRPQRDPQHAPPVASRPARRRRARQPATRAAAGRAGLARAAASSSKNGSGFGPGDRAPGRRPRPPYAPDRPRSALKPDWPRSPA